jgi:predicted Zn-dependent peptidase
MKKVYGPLLLAAAFAMPLAAAEKPAGNIEKRLVGQLNNRVTYMVEKAPVTSDWITVTMTINVGNADEGPGESGIAHLIEHMAYEGTASYPKGSRIIEAAARDTIHTDLKCNANTSRFTTGYVCRIRKGGSVDPKDIVKMFGEILSEMSMADADLDRQRTVILNEMGDPSAALSLWAPLQISGDPFYESYANLVQDVSNISIENMKKFYDVKYGSAAVTIMVLGDVDLNAYMRLLSENFIDHRKNGIATKKNRAILNIKRKNVEQSIFAETNDDYMSGVSSVSVVPEKPWKIEEYWRSHYIDLIIYQILDTRSLLFIDTYEGQKVTTISLPFFMSSNKFGVDGLAVEVRADANRLKEATQLADGILQEFKEKGVSLNEVRRARDRVLGSLDGNLDDYGLYSQYLDVNGQIAFSHGFQLPPELPSEAALRKMIMAIPDAEIVDRVKYLASAKSRHYFVRGRKGDVKTSMLKVEEGARAPRSYLPTKVPEAAIRFANPRKFTKSIKLVPQAPKIWRAKLKDGLDFVVIEDKKSDRHQLQLFGRGANISHSLGSDIRLTGEVNFSSKIIKEVDANALLRDKLIVSSFRISAADQRISLSTTRTDSAEHLFGYAKLGLDGVTDDRTFRSRQAGIVQPNLCGNAEFGFDVAADERRSFDVQWKNGFHPYVAVYAGPGNIDEISKLAEQYLSGISASSDASKKSEIEIRNFSRPKEAEISVSEISEGDFISHNICIDTMISDQQDRTILQLEVLTAIISSKIYDRLRYGDAGVYAALENLWISDGEYRFATLKSTFRVEKTKSQHAVAQALALLDEISKGQFTQAEFDQAKLAVAKQIESGGNYSWVADQVAQGKNVIEDKHTMMLEQISFEQLQKFACDVICKSAPKIVRRADGGILKDAP